MSNLNDWVNARVNADTAQWLMDIGVMHYTEAGWVVQRDIWRSPTDDEIARERSPEIQSEIDRLNGGV